jgi:hypothetical protein
MNELFLEKNQIVPLQVAGPADITGGGPTGDYVCMKNYKRCAIVVYAADGTATSGDITVTLYQSTDVSNSLSDAKALNCLVTGRIFTKQHASSFATVGQWTKETQAVADEVYVDLASGEQVNLWVLEIMASDLDADAGFDCLRADITTPGSSAKVLAALYILSDPVYSTAPCLMPSAIED